jgi:APA family basic amino acid/polyamine antiporter
VQALGLVGCLVLVATLPWTSVAVGLLVFVVGVVGRTLTRQKLPPTDADPSETF